MPAEDKGKRGPAFAGKPLRGVPVPRADLWREDEFGTALLAEYHDRVERDFAGNEVLKVFKVAAGVVHGSNPFAVCLADMIARPAVRVATLVDLQALIDSETRVEDPLSLRGSYKDAALVLRNVREPNSYLAARDNVLVGLKTELPAVVSLSGLEIVSDPDSPYGLSFNFTENTSFISAPILCEKSGHFDNALVDRSTGLPERIEGTGRYYYGSEDGLTRLYLGRGYAIDTLWDELSNSQADGRVVLVENTVPSSKMSDYLGRLDAAVELLEQ